METLAQRAARAVRRHPAPALPLAEVLRLTREQGAAVSPPILLRSVRAAPDLFRVLDPWRGAWRPPGTQAEDEEAAPAGPWLVPLPTGGGPEEVEEVAPGETGVLGGLRRSLVALGRAVDERSTTELARWFGMVREEERLRRATGPGGGLTAPG